MVTLIFSLVIASEAKAIHLSTCGAMDCFVASLLAMTMYQFISGMAKSAPSLMPDGQRAVTVLVLV
jgi:hypothetical protein